MNTFCSKVRVSEKNAPTAEYHAVHEYNDTLKNIFADEFLNSIEFQDFVERTGKQSISFSKFLEGACACPCIRAPVMRVCVDEVETAFNELVKTLNNIRKRNRNQRRPECACLFCQNEAAKKNSLGSGKFLSIIYFTFFSLLIHLAIIIALHRVYSSTL